MDNSSRNKKITLDGSTGEGGGQLIRNAVALVGILSQQKNGGYSSSLCITNIRAKRSKPGLRAQHVTAIRLIQDICRGKLLKHGEEEEEVSVGATCLDYEPLSEDKMKTACCDTTSVKAKTYIGDTQTAGSICLLLQAALPCLLFASQQREEEAHLLLKGGTNATLAPQYDYWERVFLPTLQTSNPDVSIAIDRVIRGYYPKGQGIVELRVQSLTKPLQPFRLVEPRGAIANIHIRSFHAGKLPRHLAVTLAQTARHELLNSWAKTKLPPPTIDLEIVTEQNAICSGMGLIAVATTSNGYLLAASGIVEPKQNARDTSRTVARELLQTIEEGGCVDEWLQDQLILYMALADGTSELVTGSLTQHTQTAIWVAEQVVPGVKFEVVRLDDSEEEKQRTKESSNVENNMYGQEGRISGRHLIRCKGIGFCH